MDPIDFRIVAMFTSSSMVGGFLNLALCEVVEKLDGNSFSSDDLSETLVCLMEDPMPEDVKKWANDLRHVRNEVVHNEKSRKTPFSYVLKLLRNIQGFGDFPSLNALVHLLVKLYGPTNQISAKPTKETYTIKVCELYRDEHEIGVFHHVMADGRIKYICKNKKLVMVNFDPKMSEAEKRELVVTRNADGYEENGVVKLENFSKLEVSDVILNDTVSFLQYKFRYGKNSLKNKQIQVCDGVNAGRIALFKKYHGTKVVHVIYENETFITACPIERSFKFAN